MSAFVLHSAFERNSLPIGELALCHVRLQGDARFPWLMLLPRRADVRELEDLSAADRAVLLEEIMAVSRAVRAMGEALGRPVENLNIGKLGNATPQMHIHVLGRRTDDAAWPSSPWGGGGQAYAPEAQAIAIAAARAALGLEG
jgi:diadenosine tetraphosphate (Ap4A) HIT family hydrolase